MKLYLMRHGDYLTQDIRHENPLSEQGQDDIKRMADFLKPLNIHVTHVFHSEKRRAQQTADLISKGLVCADGIKLMPGLNPLDDISSLIDHINAWGQDALIVGHLPFMGRLLGKLVVRDENKEVVMFHPGTLVCLEEIETGRWTISWVLNPAMVYTQPSINYSH
jgi:phosphohistidine phosphatase